MGRSRRWSVRSVARLSRLPVLLGAASLMMGLGLALAPASRASHGTRTRTQARIYRAFGSNGKPAIRVAETVRGSCFSGADAAVRDDAWRCLSGNWLYDPCFSSSKAGGIVLCPVAPWSRSGVELKLTKPLPRKLADKPTPSTSGLPWGIETFSGLRCGMETGATRVLDGRRANYACRHNLWLYGQPDRRTEPWTIYAARWSATKLTRRAGIKIAWF